MTYENTFTDLFQQAINSPIISSSRDLSLRRRHIAVVVDFVGCSKSRLAKFHAEKLKEYLLVGNGE